MLPWRPVRQVSNLKYIGFVVLAAVVCAAACGYRFGETKSLWATAGKTIAVPMFRNDGFVLGAESIFTEAARMAFVQGGGFRLANPGKADFTLKGRILQITEVLGASRLSDSGHRAGSYDMLVQVELALVDNTGMELSHAKLRERSDYLGAPTAAHLRMNREEALKRLARKLMRRGYKEMTEGF